MTPPQLLEEVQNRLRRRTEVDAARHPIELTYADGVLTMSGEVPNIAAKRIAAMQAEGVEGVDRVVDRLTVPPSVPMSDGELRDHVRDALYRERALATCVLRERVKGRVLLVREPAEPRGDLCVEVDDGVVFLEGDAPSLSHRRLAVALAWWVPGSRDVVDRLAVVPPEEDSDAELVDAIRLLLEADPFVDASKVSVWAEDGLITLQGVVPKVGERDFAEHDVWYVEGVRGVNNEIRVAA